ncbi:hypothetical protein [Methanosarcina acetivorans]|uniref:hypothetical protein n=1 Tax=Methanosarcina acetivorans TaxID=2214 RepID=UPI00064EA76E|nr:hypothetical protein [Methanosarcina acetivorans]
MFKKSTNDKKESFSKNSKEVLPKITSKIQSSIIRKSELKKFKGKIPLCTLKILDPVLTCKNQEKISVGYGICDDFP